MWNTQSIAASSLFPALQLSCGSRFAALEPPVCLAQPRAEPAVRLQAASGATTEVTSPLADRLPRLVLHRDGALTPPDERTLLVEVDGIDVPPSGAIVALAATPSDAESDPSAIPAWVASQRMAASAGLGRRDATVAFTHTFGGAAANGQASANPGDCFRLAVSLITIEEAVSGTLRKLTKDFEFVIEDE